MPQPKRKKRTSLKIPPKIQSDKPLQGPKANNFVITGVALVALSVVILLSIFFPILRAEFSYLFSKEKNVQVVGKSEAVVPISANSQNIELIKPVDEDFGIVIPKIAVNSKVLPDIDPENPVEYQKALTRGVAHALGTKYPGEEGNVFIFAHSGQDLIEANRYNAVFYLLSKLETKDEIYVFYKNKKFRYEVTAKKTISPEEVNYMDDISGKNTLTLMTCWPAGTNWKRLIIQAEQR